MAKVYVSYFTQLRFRELRTNDLRMHQMVPYLDMRDYVSSDVIDFTSGEDNSTVPAGATVARMHADAACWLAYNATADATAMYLGANDKEVVGVEAAGTLSALSVA